MLAEPHDTVVHMLQDAAKQTHSKTALIYEGRSLSYAEYFNCVIHFANELVEAGAAGKRIALICGNSLDMAIAYFAIHAANAQVVPLNPLYTTRELLNILRDAEPALVIHDEDLISELEPELKELKIDQLITIGEKTGRKLDVSANNTAPPLTLPSPSSLATLQYTGGTTGVSKGVNLEHRQIMINIVQRDELIPLIPDNEILLCVMPLFHVFASSMCLHASVYSRATLVIQKKFHPQTVLEALEKQAITILPAAPTILISLMGYESFKETDFSSLRLCISGAAPLPEEILTRWQNLTDSKIIEGYGQSESGPVISFNPAHGKIKPGSVGLAVANTEIQIVDLENGTQVLSTNTPGEIRVRGPQVMSGYRNRPAETKEALRDGWLYTGDIGSLDEDGYLYILDRKKDMIIVGGYKVYPREIDELLLSHDSVLEAATIGITDNYYGEKILSYVVLASKTDAFIDDLHSFFSKNLAKYKLPAEIITLDQLPKTSVGKIDRKALREIPRPQVSKSN